jgi:hypothetical protein
MLEKKREVTRFVHLAARNGCTDRSRAIGHGSGFCIGRRQAAFNR